MSVDDRKQRDLRSRWNVRTTIFAAALVVTYFAGSLVPLHRVDVAYMCRICGHYERRTTWSIAGVKVWRRTQSPPSDLESIYNRRIALPHQHQMFSYAVDSRHGNLWRYGGIGEGGPNEPAMAVRQSLEAIDAFPSVYPQMSTTERRSVYADLQKCKTREEVVNYLLKLDREKQRAATER